MSFLTKIAGLSNQTAEVNTSNELLVVTDADRATVAMMSQADDGTATGAPRLVAIEANQDYQMRTASEQLLFDHRQGLAVSPTGVFRQLATTMVAAYEAGQIRTNSASVTAAGNAVLVETYPTFWQDSAGVRYSQQTVAFTNTPIANTVIDFGVTINGGTAPYAPVDGTCFRMTINGITGVAINNSVEQETDVFAGFATITINRYYKFTIESGDKYARFWIDDVEMATINRPTGAGAMCSSQSHRWALRHSIISSPAPSVIQCLVGRIRVSTDGPSQTVPLDYRDASSNGCYEAFPGQVVGQLASWTNSGVPAAAVPTNTTAALAAGFGGRFYETDTLAVGTDGIICNLAVPTAGAGVSPRRYRLTGIKIDSFVQTVLVGGGYVAEWGLAFGHTAISLATAESVAAKAPRRVALGLQAVGAAAAVGTVLQSITVNFEEAPIYVNPGENIAVIRRKTGTAPSAGVLAHLITPIGRWVG